MTQAQLEDAVAEATGEPAVLDPRHGVRPRAVPCWSPRTSDLRVACPFCGRGVAYPGATCDGSAALAECPRCDVYFDFPPTRSTRRGRHRRRRKLDVFEAGPGRHVAPATTSPQNHQPRHRCPTRLSRHPSRERPRHDHDHAPPGPPPARRLPPFRPGHRPPGPGPAPGPPRRGRRNSGRNIATPPWPSGTPSRARTGTAEAVALPLEALADVEGRDDSPVVLEAVAPDRTVARWHDHGVPQSREYDVPALDALAPFPDEPRSWAELPRGLLDALAEATATGSDDGTRYALNCVKLRGGDAREVVATDGRQLLVHGGFAFPWAGDVLVKRSPVFASKGLPRDRPVSVGKTDAHVVLRVGPWTLYLEVQDARFPRVDQVIPDPSAVTTRLSLDAADAAFLAQALDRLPGADELNSPATVDLNGRVAVRAGAPTSRR